MGAAYSGGSRCFAIFIEFSTFLFDLGNLLSHLTLLQEKSSTSQRLAGEIGNRRRLSNKCL
jgi:hypothetical protein